MLQQAHVVNMIPSRGRPSSVSSSLLQMLSMAIIMSVTGGNANELDHAIKLYTENHTFFTDKWKRPCEDVHKVGEPVGMGRGIELANVHDIILVL